MPGKSRAAHSSRGFRFAGLAAGGNKSNAGSQKPSAFVFEPSAWGQGLVARCEEFSACAQESGAWGQESRGDRRVESGAEGHGILVEHHLARMTGRRFLRARRTDAEQDHGAWRAL